MPASATSTDNATNAAGSITNGGGATMWIAFAVVAIVVVIMWFKRKK
jgi:hypothetical protein